MYIFFVILYSLLLAAGVIFGKDYTLYLIIPPFLFVVWAQFKVHSTMKKWSAVPAGMTGREVAESLLSFYGITDVKIERVEGRLTDHYDPSTKIVRLSPDIYDGNSIAAFAVSAHEIGHAVQHHDAYKPLMLRNSFAPIAGFASKAWTFIILAGFFFNFPNLIEIGIVCFAVFFAFSVITLPVEFDASKRAVTALDQGGFLSPDEIQGTKEVLNAAAMTYVADAAMTLMQLIRLIIILNNRNE
ncbi:MAG: zinc metallopeptidase [Brevinemataceae bacterium]